MVALGNSTKDGSVIFGKNSDRQPNEPHIIIRIPRKKHPKNSKVRCTYIEVDQVEETYEALLFKPSWIWGCEMGCNEYGLNIGNEAVFTKEKPGKESLIGMDMVRLALERCRSSEDALHTIIELLQKYGQGGNCGFEKPFTYHNSFLIADKDSAWVLETAGDYWVAEKVKDVRSISNCLTIGKIFDLSHPDLISHAIRQGWCKDKEDFDFARCYSQSLITHLSGAKERLKASSAILNRDKGKITINTMKEILRHHEDRLNAKPYSNHSLKSVCMHGGFFYGDHTTGSYIASINNGLSTYWATGSSTPCLSMFKPVWLSISDQFPFGEDEESKGVAFWKEREKFFRMVLENKITNLNNYLKERDMLEADLEEKVNGLVLGESSLEEKLWEIMDYAFSEEYKLITKTMAESERNPSNIKGNPYFKYYWKKQNSNLLGK
jgi:dipeptidase